MHLTVRKYRKVGGDREQIMETVNSGFLPLITQIDGFVDFYAFFADDNTLVSVSVFRDAAGAQESVRAAAQWVVQNLSRLLPERPEVFSGDVFAHRHNEQQKAA